jgi:hypothetical protein
MIPFFPLRKLDNNKLARTLSKPGKREIGMVKSKDLRKNENWLRTLGLVSGSGGVLVDVRNKTGVLLNRLDGLVLVFDLVSVVAVRHGEGRDGQGEGKD